MKYSLFYKKVIYICIYTIIVFFINASAYAGIEDDINDITSKLRCMTCQNQTIYSSDIEFSLTIKKIVREKLEKNVSKKEIIDFLIKRYGEYITFEPEFNKQNLFLWIFPFVILALSLVFLGFRIRKIN